ncbi:MAG: hypothetical protein HRT38_18105 [Alteromonadaceae bacterium]|nr:hypothetical protein [Alteromonadaceae bacterium]
MIAIILGLIIVLIIIVVVVNGIQQHREKLEQQKRAKVSRQKAIVDETEELILNLTNLPPNPNLIKILNNRSLVAAKTMHDLMPEIKSIINRVSEMQARLNASKELAANVKSKDETFILPDNEQQLVAILQCIKKLRAVLKSEQSRGNLDAPTYVQEDRTLETMQLQISIESLIKRGSQSFEKEMYGSARQYFEKAMQTINGHPHQSEYTTTKKEQLEDKLTEIANSLKITNEQDRERKAKNEEDELDVLFQPKKKW